MKLTSSAKDRIIALIEKQPEPNVCLRISVLSGGCSGYQYDMSFDKAKKDDRLFDIENHLVVVDPTSYSFLEDVTIDYQESVMGSSFVYTNLSASRVCGCGTSFAD
jgi:iron-sulfur cluster assembly accessory protein